MDGCMDAWNGMDKEMHGCMTLEKSTGITICHYRRRFTGSSLHPL